MSGPTITKDPANQRTVILDRWPTREEKEQFAEDVRSVRRGDVPEEPASYLCRKGCGQGFETPGGRTYHENNSTVHNEG